MRFTVPWQPIVKEEEEPGNDKRIELFGGSMNVFDEQTRSLWMDVEVAQGTSP